MILAELTEVPSAAIPVAAFAAHLHLGTGFADDGSQDALLETLLRAAMSAIEARTGKAILARSYALELPRWRDAACQTIPVAPVSAITGLSTRDRDGAVTVLDPADVILVKDAARPQIQARYGHLPPVPPQGSVTVTFDAGFGAAWSDVPDDLAQAVMLQAAHFHEHRGDGAADAGLPAAVNALIAPYRVVRTIGGGA